MSILRAFSVLCMGFILPLSASAGAYTWTGAAGSGSWGADGNWSSVPTFDNTSDLAFTGSVQPATYISANRTIRSLIFDANADTAISIRFSSQAGGGASRSLTMGGGIAPTITIDVGASAAHTVGVAGGNLVLAGPLTVAHNGPADFTISRPVTGANSLTKTGSGTLVLSAANTYTGGTLLSGGSLLVNGSLAAGQVALTNSGTLGGTGSVAGAIVAYPGSTLAPGSNSVGTLTAGSGVTVTGATFRVALVATNAGSYGQLGVTAGNVVVTNAFLDISSSGYAPSNLDAFWIVNNTGAGTFSGSFKGFLQGVQTNLGGFGVKVYYNANFATGSTNGGNDVLLSIIPIPVAQTITNVSPANGSKFLTTDSVTLSAQASSGLAVTNFTVISGPGVIAGLTNLAFTSAGTVLVAANQAGDPYWLPAPAVTNAYAVTAPPPPSGWFTPGGTATPGGQWANEANAIDGNTATYASHTSPGAGQWGAPIWLTNSIPFKCGRVRVYSDWNAAYADMVRLEVRLNPSGTWTNVYEGSVQNCNWSEITFASTNIDAARYSYHYVAGAIVFWLYEFRFYADSGQVNLPACETRAATSVEESSAILHGVVADDGGELCQYRFQYGLTTSYSASTDWSGQLSNNDEFSALITGLAPFSTYHFRVQIKNSAGISSGADMTLTTGLPPTGWVSPAGYADSGAWTNIAYAFDGNLNSFATCYHPINTPVWSPDLYLTHSAMTCERIRFNARDTAEIDMAVVQVDLNGAWTTVYSNNTFANQEWVEASFPRGTVTQARVKFSLTGTGFGLDWQLYEFDFYRVVDVMLSGTYDGARRVSLAVDGVYRGSFTNFTTNVYTFVETMGAGSRILVYYDDDDSATNSGALVSRVSGDDLTDLDLVDNTLILRNDIGASLTAADLAAAYASDGDVPYSIAGGNVAVASNIAVRIPAGAAFDAGTNTLTFRSDLVNEGALVFDGGTAVFAGNTVIRGASTSAFDNVVISGGVTAHSNLMTVAGAWVQNGVFSHNGGTVAFSGNTVMSGAATPGFNNIEIGGGLTAPATLNVAGNFLNNGSFSNNNGTVVFNGTSLIGGSSPTTFSDVTIAAAGSLVAPSGFLYVSGNWSNRGVFAHNDGTVVFTTPSQATITGSNAFNNFTCTTPGKQINFGAGETQAVLGAFSVSGANGNNIRLRSSVGTDKWSIRFPNAAQTVGYVDVRDSDALDNTVTVGGGNNSGSNNANWIFASSRYWVGGSGSWSDTNHWALLSGGTPGASVPGSGNIVVFDVNSGAAATCTVDQAVSVLELDLEALNTVALDQGASGITVLGGGFRQSAGTFQGGAGNFDVVGGFVLVGGAFIAPSASLTLRAGFAHTGGVFINNAGTVVFAGNTAMTDSVADPFSNIVISNSVAAPSGSLRVTGNWTDSGIFVHNGGTVVFEGNSVVGGSSTSRFRNITISGALTAGASPISVEGSWVNQGMFDPNGGSVIFAGNTEITGSSTSRFSRVTITGGLSGHSMRPVRLADAWVNNGTFNPNNGVVVFDGSTEISGSSTSTFNHVVIEGSLTGHAGKPFRVAGNWTQNGSYNDNNGTVIFNGSSQLGGSRTSQFHNIEIWGVMTAPATNLMVSGDWINHGTFNHNNGAVVFNGTTLMSGANVSTFSNMIVAGTVRLQAAGRIGDTSAVAVQGILDLDGKAETIASLAGAGQVTLGGADLILAGNASTLFSGAISGSGALVKRGTGTLTLAGANAYTGSTRVENGAIEVATTNALPVTTILRLGNSSDTGSARLDLVGFNQQVAGLISDGVLMPMRVTNTVYAFSTLGINNGEACSYAGLIGGHMSIVKEGAGTLTLGGGTNGLSFSNSYDGNTLIRAGQLVIGADSTIALSTNVTVLAGGGMTILNTANVLNDDAEVYLSSGSKLTLTNGVNDEIWSLYLDGQIAAAGVWGAVGCQWTNTDYFAGSGTLIVSNGVALPVITITNTASGIRLPFRTTQYTLAGQAQNVVGSLWYTNSWGQGETIGTLPAGSSWTIPLTLPTKGTYTVVICGTNGTGMVTQESVTIIRNRNQLFWFAR